MSAIGKTHPTDTKVTDILIALHQNLPDMSLFDLVAQKYQKLAKTFQYSALIVLGTEGIKLIKRWWGNNK